MDRGTVVLLFNTTKKILQSSCASKLSTATHTAWGTKTPPSSPVANLTAVVQRGASPLGEDLLHMSGPQKQSGELSFPDCFGGDILNYKVLKRGGETKTKAFLQ